MLVMVGGMRGRRIAVSFLLLGALGGCSTVLDYDAMRFSQDDAGAGDVSIRPARDGGADGSRRDAHGDGGQVGDAAVLDDGATRKDSASGDACKPDCSGKVCGESDGCGGKCTTCPDGKTCDVDSGVCACEPKCDGKKCGDDDSCGGHCMNCPPGEYCSTTSWRCLCQKDCDNKFCGESDGCGGKCTACKSSTELCNMSTWTCEDACLGVDCGEHGTCGVKNGYAVCNCEPGYYQPAYRDPTCIPKTDDACTGITCSGHGTCHVDTLQIPECHCEPGYVSYWLECIPLERVGCVSRKGTFVPRGTSRCSDDDSYIEVCRDEDGDGRMEWAWGGNCANGGPCSQCIHLGCDVQPCPLEQICIQMVHGSPYNRCEIECDCSNCPNCPPGTWAAKCGSFTYNPTTVCNRPCMPGTGCAMFDTHHGVCWPGEGCDSAAP